MTGRVRLILLDLMTGVPVESISNKWGLSPGRIRSIARENNISQETISLSPEDLKNRKRIRDAKRYLKRCKFDEGDNPVCLPQQAAKHSSIGSLDKRWVLRQAYHSSTVISNYSIQRQYGLKTAASGQ